MAYRKHSPVDIALSRRALIAGALSGLGGLALAGCTDLGGRGGAARGGADSLPVIMDKPGSGAADTGATPSGAASTASFMMVGDILVHPGVWKSGMRADGTYNYDHIYAQIAGDAAGVDVAMLNQETILGGTAMGLSTFPNFNSPQELGDAEAKAGFDVALAATNHSADMGMAGIEAECKFWRERHPEVRLIGIYDNQAAYDAVDVLEVNGIKVAVLNHTFSLNGLPDPAPYAVRLLEEEKFAADYRKAREAGAQMVVEVPHWGTEYVYEPDDYQREWAQRFLEAGVDVVIGSHPHVIEPVETLTRADGHKMLVFWSLGNFTSFQVEKPRMIGGMAKVTFEARAAEKKGGEATAAVRDWSFEPVVTHRAEGTAFTTYKLANYPEELAAQNGIRELEGCADFSRAWCDDLCAQVLGAGYDRAACILRGGAL